MFNFIWGFLNLYYQEKKYHIEYNFFLHFSFFINTFLQANIFFFDESVRFLAGGGG